MKCPVCEKDFEIKSKHHPWQKTCSKKCTDRNHYINNKESRISQSKNWRIKNPLRRAEIVKGWTIRNPEYESEKQKRYREALSDSYIKTVIIGKSKIKRLQIPKPLIEIKRLQIQIQRHIKQNTQ